MRNMFKVNNKDTKRRHWHRSGVFIVNSEHISYFVLLFLLLTLNMWLPDGLILKHEPRVFSTNTYMIGLLLKMNLPLSKKKYVKVTVVVARRRSYKVSVNSL